MNQFKLIEPINDLKEQAFDYRLEHFNNDEYFIYGSSGFDTIVNYDTWLNNFNKNSKPFFIKSI